MPLPLLQIEFKKIIYSLNYTKQYDTKQDAFHYDIICFFIFSREKGAGHEIVLCSFSKKSTNELVSNNHILFYNGCCSTRRLLRPDFQTIEKILKFLQLQVFSLVEMSGSKLLIVGLYRYD